MLKRLISLIVVCICIYVGVFHLLFTVPSQPELLTAQEQHWQHSFSCYHNQDAQPVDQDGHLRLLVWNIYKQNRHDWSGALTRLSHNRDLVLLQEASFTVGLRRWLTQGDWNANQVRAFSYRKAGAGVMTFAHAKAHKVCAYTAMEPWLRLPKSGLYSLYPLSNGQSLAVINIHAINFSVGTKEYLQQIITLRHTIAHHHGPVIFAGDFNSWNQWRVRILLKNISHYGFKEVKFAPDHRKRFITGLALDHVFYRGLTLIKAEAPQSDASDHNPLLVEFKLAGTP